METEPSPIDDYILQLTGKHRPRLCLVSTPSGDLPDYIERFYAAFSQRSCEPSHLAFFFRDIRPGAVALKDWQNTSLAQDAIFVSGGNTRAALSVWQLCSSALIVYALGNFLCRFGLMGCFVPSKFESSNASFFLCSQLESFHFGYQGCIVLCIG